MIDYTSLLALAYFREKKQEYTIGELMEILGLDTIQIKRLIESLLEVGYIEYYNNLLQISKKGLTRLISENQDALVLSSNDLKLKHIKPENSISVEDPFVPREFDQKIPT